MTNAIHADEKQSREGLLFGLERGEERSLVAKVSIE